MFVTQARAQYRAVGNDGIAASPKVRQMLDEQKLSAPKPKTNTMASCCQDPALRTTATATKCCGQCSEHVTKQPQPAPTK